jgi:hypothetical protein
MNSNDPKRIITDNKNLFSINQSRVAIQNISILVYLIAIELGRTSEAIVGVLKAVSTPVL